MTNPVGSPVKVKVVGIGGGGGNAISRMLKCNIKDIDYLSEMQHAGRGDASGGQRTAGATAAMRTGPARSGDRRRLFRAGCICIHISAHYAYTVCGKQAGNSGHLRHVVERHYGNTPCTVRQRFGSHFGQVVLTELLQHGQMRPNNLRCITFEI